MDITKAQFWNTPNTAGRESFSYAELLAQLTKDLPTSAAVSLQARNTTPFSTPTVNNVPIILPFGISVFDDAGFFDLAGNRFVIPVTVPQITRVTLSCYAIHAQNATGERELILLTNGIATTNSEEGTEPGATTANSQMRLTFSSSPIAVVPGDFFQFQYLQNSGGALNVFRWNCGIQSIK